jgi:hypothetical protein
LLKERSCCGLILGHKSDSKYTVKIPKKTSLKKEQEYEEIDIDLANEKEGFSTKTLLTVRVIASEQKKFSVTTRREVNDKIMDVAKEIAE